MTPVNGRNYLDLSCGRRSASLTPGVVPPTARLVEFYYERAGEPERRTRSTSGLDTSGAILGERAGNTSFVMDGLWNNNTFGGGVLQNLTQDTVEQFETST